MIEIKTATQLARALKTDEGSLPSQRFFLRGGGRVVAVVTKTGAGDFHVQWTDRRTVKTPARWAGVVIG